MLRRTAALEDADAVLGMPRIASLPPPRATVRPRHSGEAATAGRETPGRPALRRERSAPTRDSRVEPTRIAFAPARIRLARTRVRELAPTRRSHPRTDMRRTFAPTRDSSLTPTRIRLAPTRDSSLAPTRRSHPRTDTRKTSCTDNR